MTWLLSTMNKLASFNPRKLYWHLKQNTQLTFKNPQPSSCKVSTSKRQNLGRCTFLSCRNRITLAIGHYCSFISFSCHFAPSPGMKCGSAKKHRPNQAHVRAKPACRCQGACWIRRVASVSERSRTHPAVNDCWVLYRDVT